METHSDEAPRSDDRGIFSLLLRRERNPSEAETSSHSFLQLRSGFSAKGDKRRVWQVVVAIVIVNIVVNNFSLLNQTWNSPSKRALAQKDAIVKEIVNRQDAGEFFVSYIANIGWNSGFGYLFKYYGAVPQTREVKDPIYTIVLPKELSPDAIDVAAGDVGLILPDNEEVRSKK